MKIPAERRRLDRVGSHAQKNPESNAVITCAKFRKFFSSKAVFVMRLSAVMELEEKISAARAELDRLKALATATTTRIDGLPKAKSITSRVESLTAKIVDCERRLAILREALICTQVDLTLELSAQLPSDVANVMILRYVNVMSFTEIANALHYSRGHIHRICKRGLALFNDK